MNKQKSSCILLHPQMSGKMSTNAENLIPSNDSAIRQRLRRQGQRRFYG